MKPLTEIQETAALELTNAIRELYTAFSTVPRPLQIEFCPCGCTRREEVAALLAGPLRALRFPDLANYSFSAMTTQGSADDFRYFLPRLLERIATEPYKYSPEILFGKLRYATWETWPEPQRNAVKNYLRRLWLNALITFPIEEKLPAFPEIESVLSSIAQTGEMLSPYLQLWDESRPSAADEHLIQFVTFYGEDFAEGQTLSFAFWKAAQPQAKELRNWILKPATIERILSAAPLLKNDGFEHCFGPAVEILRRQATR